MSVAHSGHANPTGRLVAEHPALVRLGRAGWFAKGLVYLIGGVLSLLIAAKASGWSTSATAADQEASPTGAIKTVAGMTGGAVMLWLLAFGMLLYAAWRVTSVLMPGDSDAKAWLKRIGYIVSAIVYATFAFTAISLARHASVAADSNSKVNSVSDRLMSHSGGRLLVGIVGVVVISAGIYRIAKGAKQDINDELDLSGMSPQRLKLTERLGQIGDIGRGVGTALVGFFLLRAAITFDPNDATGLDGALRRLATNSWGQLVVVVVGVGFVAYGAFCLATFTRRRLETP